MPRSLQESEDFLRLLFDSAAEGFYAVDHEGVTTNCPYAFTNLRKATSYREAWMKPFSTRDPKKLLSEACPPRLRKLPNAR